MIAASVGKKGRGGHRSSSSKAVETKVGDVDLAIEFDTLPNRYDQSAKSYGSMMKRYTKFCGVDPPAVQCPVELVADEPVAKFAIELGKASEWHPSASKTFFAGIGSHCERYGLPKVFEHKHEWPLTTNAVSIWKAKMKEHPHFPQKAGQFDFEAIKEILNLDCANAEEIRDVAIQVCALFIGKRADDMVHWLSKNTKILTASAERPRLFKFVQTTSKGSKVMTGPIEDRTSVLPCTCLSVLKDNKPMLRSFVTQLKKDPFVPCPVPCPFACVKRYYDLCPDNCGVDRMSEIETAEGVDDFTSTLEDVRFFRAVNSCRDISLRQFTLYPLGEQNHHVIIIVTIIIIFMLRCQYNA